MDRFCGMQKHGWCSGGTERRRDLARDDAALAHSGDNDASVAGVQHIDDLRERSCHRARKTVSERAKRFGFRSDDIGAYDVHSNQCRTRSLSGFLDLHIDI